VDVLEEEWRQPSPDSPDQVTATLTEIRKNLTRLEDLVHNYLTLVRMSQVERTPQDFGAVLATWAAEWRVLTQGQGVQLQVEGLEEVGTIAFHSSTLQRALLNLVQNAMDVMPQGGHAHPGRPAHRDTRHPPRARYGEWHPGRAARHDFRAVVYDQV
jgi:signal transduction histidine kinase